MNRSRILAVALLLSITPQLTAQQAPGSSVEVVAMLRGHTKTFCKLNLVIAVRL